MKVKYLQGDRDKRFLVVLPEDKEIKDLPAPIQEAIAKLGNLTYIKSEDLSNRTGEESSKIIKDIKEQGASLRKIEFKLKEIEISHPPFSELR